MTGHRLEVATLTLTKTSFSSALGPCGFDQQRKVLRVSADAERRRSALISERCDRCNYETVAYDSCRNRHRPKCQVLSTRSLVSEAGLACRRCPTFLWSSPYRATGTTRTAQPASVLQPLFRAASETLLEIAADPRHLGARIGLLAVLHTWSQNLGHHPHLHCLAPAGGLASTAPAGPDQAATLPAGTRAQPYDPWASCSPPQAELSAQPSRLPGTLAGPLSRVPFTLGWSALRSKGEWVVYPSLLRRSRTCAQVPRPATPIASPSSNRRLLGLENGQVRFRRRDSRHNNRSVAPRASMQPSSSASLPASRALPAGFVKIRHFGLLANRNRSQALAVQGPSPRHHRGQQRTTDRAGEVRTQPVPPPVQGEALAPAPATLFC